MVTREIDLLSIIPLNEVMVIEYSVTFLLIGNATLSYAKCAYSYVSSLF